MGQDYKIKLGSVLSLDSIAEKDLIERLEELKSRHKLGDFIAFCVRTCYEKPSISMEMLDNLGSTGIHKNRETFFSEIADKVKDMQAKVNNIYDMVFTMYTMVQCGKRIGIEEKSDNFMLASFLIQRQLDKLVSEIGISKEQFNWNSLDSEITQERVARVVELLIESYSGNILNAVIQETKRDIVVKSDGQVQETRHNEDQNINNNVVGENIDSTVGKKVDEQVEMQLHIVSEKDFESNANWGALNSFLNF